MAAAKDLETRIRLRAYQIWEEEGRPQGRADIHWRMAEAELRAPPPASMAGPTPKPASVAKKKRTGGARKGVRLAAAS